VVQLSINASKSADYHLRLGAKLAALRSRGVLLVGSGNVVHNLRALDWHAPDMGFDWARRYNEKAIDLARLRPEDAGALMADRDFAQVAPTPEHFLPFLYVAGFGAQLDKPLEVLVDGYAYGSLSMTCFTVDLDCPTRNASTAGASELGSIAPPEDTNL
jgi:4,5-DOPA dioxygenase extradiol